MNSVRLFGLFVASLASMLACSATPSESQSSSEQRIVTSGDASDPTALLPGACAHSVCAAGEALEAACDPCATSLCAKDPFCCGTTWDATCVGEVASICGKNCTVVVPADDGGATACAHAVCATGAPLTATCDACAVKLCAQDPYCCSTSWDASCVGEVASICGKACK